MSIMTVLGIIIHSLIIVLLAGATVLRLWPQPATPDPDAKAIAWHKEWRAAHPKASLNAKLLAIRYARKNHNE